MSLSAISRFRSAASHFIMKANCRDALACIPHSCRCSTSTTPFDCACTSTLMPRLAHTHTLSPSYTPDTHLEWTVACIGTVSLMICLAISLKGAGFFAKFNIFFFAVQVRNLHPLALEQVSWHVQTTARPPPNNTRFSIAKPLIHLNIHACSRTQQKFTTCAHKHACTHTHLQMFATAWGIVSFLTPQSNINPRGATIFNASSPDDINFLSPCVTLFLCCFAYRVFVFTCHDAVRSRNVRPLS